LGLDALKRPEREWIFNQPDSEIKWMGRLATRDVVSFMTRHNNSADWLLCGDLKGGSKPCGAVLPSRSRRHEAPPPIPQEAQPATAVRSLKTAEAVTANGGAGSGPRLKPVNSKRFAATVPSVTRITATEGRNWE
jgi:hypothetical protein